MSGAPIVVDNVSKKYLLGERGYSSLREDIMNIFTFPRQQRKSKCLWALKDVSFELARGDVLGLIGPNGAGKSTLLKLLAKVTVPESGRVLTRGRIGALIELSAGFHHELTGRENIYFYGSIMGLRKKEITAKFDQIVEFSELGDFLDTPIKRYSSGMKARLGFSISVHVDPDILLIDEVLSVGDLSFQAKCLDKIKEYCSKGVTIIFVSHNLESVRKICKRTILLKKGRIVFDGDTVKAIDKYFSIVSEEKKCLTYVDGDDEQMELAKISDAQLLNDNGVVTANFRSGDTAVFKFNVTFRKDAKVFFNFLVWRDDRLLVYDTSQYLLKKEYVEGRAGTCMIVEFRFKVNLLKGIYHIGTHITDFDNNVYLDVIDNAGYIFVSEEISYSGVANLDSCVQVKEAKV